MGACCNTQNREATGDNKEENLATPADKTLEPVIEHAANRRRMEDPDDTTFLEKARTMVSSREDINVNLMF